MAFVSVGFALPVIVHMCNPRPLGRVEAGGSGIQLFSEWWWFFFFFNRKKLCVFAFTDLYSSFQESILTAVSDKLSLWTSVGSIASP